MSKLAWDAAGTKLFETGTKMGVIYPINSSGAYPMGYAWNGLISVSENPSGADSNPLYADDIKYLDLKSAEEFGATINAYTYPDEFAVCDGTIEAVDGMYLGQQTRKAFGLCYRTTIGNDTDGNDHGYKLHLIYNAMASPSEKSYQTINDSPEAIEFSWEITTTPTPVTGIPNAKPTASITIDSTKFTTTEQKALLTALENKLYGTDGNSGTDPYLPLPAEVYTTLGGTLQS